MPTPDEISALARSFAENGVLDLDARLRGAVETAGAARFTGTDHWHVFGGASFLIVTSPPPRRDDAAPPDVLGPGLPIIFPPGTTAGDATTAPPPPPSA